MSSSYLVYTADTEGVGDQIWYRPLLSPDDLDPGTQPVIGDEFRISLGRGFDIRSINCLAMPTAGQVMVVFEDRYKNIWRLIHDFDTDAEVESVSQLFDGERPVLGFDGLTRLLYLRLGDVRLRNDFGSELTLVTPSEREIDDLDAVLKSGESVFRYAGAHFLSQELALDLIDDGSVVALYDGEVSVAPSFVDQVGGYDAALSGENAELTRGFEALDSTSSAQITAIPIPAALTIEAWITLRGKAKTVNVVNGPIELSVSNQGILSFAFSGARLVQKSGRVVEPGQRTHIFVSHTFGAGAGTFMAVNGEPVGASWDVGTGNETPGLGNEDLTIEMGEGNAIEQLRFSDVARSLSYVLDYIGGRI